MKFTLSYVDTINGESPLTISKDGMDLKVMTSNPFVSNTQEVTLEKFIDVLFILKRTNKKLDEQLKNIVWTMLKIYAGNKEKVA